MDVLDVRRRYGRNLRIWGGVDKRALARGPAAIDAELGRLKSLIAEGGYILHLDHSCPSDISFPNFCYHLKDGPRYAGNRIQFDGVIDYDLPSAIASSRTLLR